MLDPRDEAYDRRLARHLVSLYYQSEEKMEEEYMDMAVLRDYIAYARSYVNPRLGEEASQALIEVKELLLRMLRVFPDLPKMSKCSSVYAAYLHTTFLQDPSKNLQQHWKGKRGNSIAVILCSNL